jgi:glycosyltransferase involved in cell wall biosynthesis
VPLAFSVVAGADTGGQSIRIHDAFQRHGGEWTVRAATLSNNYIGYPMDLPYRTKVVEEFWRQADVVHLHNTFRTAAMFDKRLGSRPSVLHHHGTVFRTNPGPLLQESRRRGTVGITSTLDLWLIAPDELEWLPAPYNLDFLAQVGEHHRREPDGRIVICSAPTNRTIKSTDAFLEAVKRLQNEDYPVDLELIERERWDRCLERKARADIFFDQVILGYGCNALEAWGMGIPVVCGAADPTLDEMERRFGRLPFYHATEETIYDALRELVESPVLRQRYAQIGQQYVREYHDEAKVVEQLKAIYQRAIDEHKGERAA